jgi:hypothetical protein
MRSQLFRLGLVVLLAGCSARTRPQAPDAPTVLEVQNQTTFDMTIYVLRTVGARQRLGNVTATTTAWFTIPQRLIFGLTPLRFQADPLGGSADPVTQEITVEPGDTVVLILPPR